MCNGITEIKGKDGIYAEVRFKGRLDGQYSVDLTKDNGDGYLKTKIV